MLGCLEESGQDMHSSAPPRDDVVQYSVQKQTAVLTIDNPPVNALGVGVRRGLLDGVARAEADPSVRAVLITGTGKQFLAGADLRELGRPPLPPTLPEVCNAIEACPKLVVVAINGSALGGGLEVALAAHHRLATRSSKLGLPEVQLGLIPGAGGTQRAPRLLGVQAALSLMLSGRHASAEEALGMGLIDEISPGEDAREAALARVQALLDQGARPRRTRDRTEALADRAAQLAALDAARADTEKIRGLFSPMKIVEAVQASLDQPFEEGLRTERELFSQCLASPQSAGLIHAFFAEREVLKSPETRAGRPRLVEQVGVIGGGTMGAGIAVAMLDAGLSVTMIERDEAALAQGRSRVEKVYDGLIAKGRQTPQGKGEVMERFKGSMDFGALAGADLVVEAVFEDMAVKKVVFNQLDRVCKRGAVLGTNTSYLDIAEIADATSRPEDVIGLHFFSPANIMKLLEIVVPAKVSADVVATAFALAKRLRKVPVRAGVCDGFIGNRILAVYRQAADFMMEDGASPYEIDQMARNFGFPIGPYEMSDLAGGDIGWAARKRRSVTRDPRARYVRIADRLCERGWFGQKTGRGWYVYPHGRRTGTPDPEVLAIIEEERARAGVAPRPFTEEELRRRYLAAMVNEAAKVVAEGIALRPLDVDVTLVHGYGFPRARGGPTKYADMVGLGGILADLREFASADPLFWSPAPLLVHLVERGANFESLDRPETSHA